MEVCQAVIQIRQLTRGKPDARLVLSELICQI